MDIVESVGRACGEFDRRVREVRADQWQLGTPCPDWDVRALVNHVAVENLWAPPLLRGSTIRLDPELVDLSAKAFAEQEKAYWSSAAIAERPPIPDGAGAQTRPLAMFGRSA